MATVPCGGDEWQVGGFRIGVVSGGLRVGGCVPWGLWEETPERQRELMGTVADAGIDFVFSADHVSFRDGSGTDGVVALAALSGLESRLGLLLGVYLLGLRHPMIAARQIATLAQAVPGRLVVGVGVGGEDRHEVEVCEVDPSTRGRRTDAALSIVRRLLAGETVDGDGEFFGFTGGKVLPVPEPAVSFMVGGRSEAALRRAGTLGDGWLGAWCSTERFSAGVAQVEAHAEQAGRSAGTHGLQLWAGVGDTPEQGLEYVAKKMSDFYKLDFAAFEKYTPTGTPEQIAEFLKPYVDAGAKTLCIATCGVDRETEIETVGQIAEMLK